ncbi:hypothetical protein LFL96_00055 [Paraburkholderia sp. D15]|uniref:hypothetical protein n=1 Tax=Paraburkholderia sp. D15 TaxID=2880218 RepID=UPI002479200D|nr:hypothetical protein [Paraburkholderia sp. D15]WGS49945.1 hypothetical protein LFL96_00055 [Paraburkholderia sp. D15]
MKPLAMVVLAACLTLTACGGDDVSDGSGTSSSSGNGGPGSSGNPSSPGNGGTAQAQAGWSTAAAMDGKAAEFEPSTTIDAKGNSLVTWMSNGPSGTTGNEMWGSRYVAGSGWSTPTRLDTSDGSDAMTGTGTGAPQLVGNASGQAVAFWTQWMPAASKYALWARPYSPSAGWGTATEIAPNITSLTYTAGIDAQGNALVAWPQSISLLDSRIAWTRYTPDGTWSTTALIQMPAQTGPGAVTGDTTNVRPMISVLPSGSAVLAWGQTNSTQSAIWTATFDQTDGWTNINQAVSNTSLFTSIDTPTAGMDAKGNITLVWGQLDATGGKLYTTTMSQRYVAGTGWQAAQAVAPEITEAGGFIATPILSVGANGVAAVMWAQGGVALQASVSDANGNWGPLHQLTASIDPTTVQYPPIVVDPAGNVTAAWQDAGTPGSSDVIAASYRNGAWTTSTLFGQDPQDASWPALAVNASGAMSLVWQLYINSVGPELQASFYTPGT